MSYYHDLQRMDMGEAINKMAEIILPCFSAGKILSVNIMFGLSDYRRRKHHRAIVNNADYTFIYHRPQEWMIAGFLPGSHLNLPQTPPIAFLGHSQRDWKQEVEKKISEIASHLSKRYEEEDGLTVHTGFGAYGVQLIAGNIKVKASGKLNFIPIN